MLLLEAPRGFRLGLGLGLEGRTRAYKDDTVFSGLKLEDVVEVDGDGVSAAVGWLSNREMVAITVLSNASNVRIQLYLSTVLVVIGCSDFILMASNSSAKKYSFSPVFKVL